MLIDIISAFLRNAVKNIVFGFYASSSERIHFLVTVINNFLPAFVTLFFGWNAGDVLLYFWAENIVTGFFHTLKLIIAKGGEHSWMDKLRYIFEFNRVWIFVNAILGVFCVIFTMMIYALGNTNPERNWELSDYELQPLIIVVCVSVAMYSISFFWEYLYNGEYKLANPLEIYMAPMNRFLILHVSVLTFGLIFIGIIALIGKFPAILDLGSIVFTTISTLAALILGGFKTLFEYQSQKRNY